MIFNLKHEFWRKCLHFLLIFVPVGYCQFGKWTSLVMFALLTSSIAIPDYLRRKNPQIAKFFVKIFSVILRPHELSGDKLCGASWVGFAACLNFLLFKSEIAVTSFAIFVVSDGLSALIGKAFPGRPFFEKSLNGALAFFISGTIVLLICGAIFHSKAWFYLIGFFALFCVTIIESRPSLFKIDDNFTIPIGFSLIMTFFDLVWNYSY